MTIPMGANFEAPSEPAADPTTVVTADEKGSSQGRLIFKRFLQHKPALISIVLFVLIVGFAISATGIFGIPGWWQYELHLAAADPGRRQAHARPSGRSRWATTRSARTTSARTTSRW